jgi:ketol-acid reductoisomerase
MPKPIKDKDGNTVAELLQEEDITSNLKDKTIAVIGYASQGRGQSLCYRDSGITTILGLRKDGNSWTQAIDDGWRHNKDLFEIAEATKRADILVILTADTAQPEIYKEHIESNLKPGQTLVFSHGFNIHFKGIIPADNIDISMIAPKGPGTVLRQQYESGFGIPALVAVHQDHTGKAWDNILALAKAAGCAKPGLLKTTFKDEVESDLFGEQVDLCGGVIEMVKHAFDTLVEAGYNPALAYWETHHELHGLIAPLAYKYGNFGMLNRVSLTARKGALECGKKVMDENVKSNMKKCLNSIQDGTFAKEWMEEYKEHGFTQLNEELLKLRNHDLETTGKQIRQIMWPNDKVHE